MNEDGNFSDWTTAGGRPAKVTLPVIRFDSHNRLYCLWADTFDIATGSFDVYLRYSEDYGFTWSNRILVNDQTAGDQWMPDMDIDSEDNLHIVYYSELFGIYKPYYRKISISGESRDLVSFSSVAALTDTSTLSNFTRPGDYFTIRLDSIGTPHIVWTDGRDNEMDIYYAHQVDYEPTTTTSTTTTTTTTSSTTTTTTTSTTSGTESASPVPLIIGGAIGLGVIIVVAIVLFRKKTP